MKLRNKLTGEINILKVDEDYFNIYKDDGEFVCPVTLKELNEGWEDYEEPKKYWYISPEGKVYWFFEDDEGLEASKQIGNYFDTRKEAEQAIEKLKAWKRLKDKGFRFTHWTTVRKEKAGKVGFKCDEIRVTFDEARQFYADLDLIFGD